MDAGKNVKCRAGKGLKCHAGMDKHENFTAERTSTISDGLKTLYYLSKLWTQLLKLQLKDYIVIFILKQYCVVSLNLLICPTTYKEVKVIHTFMYWTVFSLMSLTVNLDRA